MRRMLRLVALSTAFAMLLSTGCFAQQQTIQACTKGEGEARIIACTDLIKRGGKNVEAYYYYRSIARQDKDECDLALADAEKALSLRRDESNIIRTGNVWSDCKLEPDRAMGIIEEAIRLFPKSAVAYFNRAVMLDKKGEHKRALEDFNQAIRLDPRDPDYPYRRGRLWADQEEYDKAIVDYSQAIRLKSTYAKALSYRGLAYSNKDENEKAIFDHDKAIKLDPKNADHYDNRAITLRRQGNYDQALADHDAAVKLSPVAAFYRSRGNTWRSKGDLDRALTDLNEAVRVERGVMWSRLYRGIVLRYRGEYDRAITDFNAVLDKHPFDATTYVERGRAHEKRGDLVRARADFERALKAGGSQAKSAYDDARAQLASLDAGPPKFSAVPAATPLPSAATATLREEPQGLAAATTAIEQAGRRVALVIGNSEYTSVPKLPNPARDAQAVASALRSIGFQTVTVGGDLSREKLVQALRAFAVEAENADWAMVYFAGHGIEIGGVNYLIPVDAKLSSDRDAQFEAVSLEQVMTSVEGARKIKLVILDACRDNPFATQMRRTLATRSIGRGLSRVEPEGASLVVYAAKHGQTALDGIGANSPFATALTKRIATPGIDITKLFRLVRDDVMEATGGRQEPFTYGSLPGREDFYFVARN